VRIEQKHWTRETGWYSTTNGDVASRHDRDADLVFVFGASAPVADGSWFEQVRGEFPGSHIVSASTAGEIHDTRVWDDSMSLTAVSFDDTRVRVLARCITDSTQSRGVGQQLAAGLEPTGLRHVIVIAEGLRVNGSELARGLGENLPGDVAVTGGLAGDGARMEHTVVGLDAPPAEGNVVALGFYGDRIRVGYGSRGGWDTFGPERLITRSNGNVLYELDGRSALELYKTYLGEEAKGLPATGLLFPLAVRLPGSQSNVVRTILGVDEASNSLTFAGDMPEGAYARLMKANFERLIDGAAGAARRCAQSLTRRPELALLISCVGRKLILKHRTEDEVKGVRDVLGAGAALTGFYSYGEICPHSASVKGELHNQTMTITAFAET
jgi:hypothetical protein